MTDQGVADDVDHAIGVGMGGACPNCSAPVDLAQEFCLECGAPVRVRKKLQRSTRSHRPSSFPWVPFVVVLGLVAFGVTTALLADEHPRSGGNTDTEAISTGDTSTDEIPTVPPTPSDETTTDEVPTVEEDPTTTSTSTDETDDTTDTPETTPTTSTTTPTTGGSSTTWPTSKSGYTVVISSLNKSLYSREDADSRASEATGKGLTAGVLDSDSFSSLASGLWVVFSGIYDDEDQANAHLPTVTSAGYPSAYVRQVAP
jgi:hypothetical protein